MNDHLKGNNKNNEGHVENLTSEYPHGFTNDTLQQWAKSTNFSGSFEAYLPGIGEKRGVITITNIGPTDGQLKILWAPKCFALLPDGCENDPVYLSSETVKKLGITLNLTVTGRHQKTKEDLAEEIALVKAEKKYRTAASTKGTTPDELMKLEAELSRARNEHREKAAHAIEERIPDTERQR